MQSGIINVLTPPPPLVGATGDGKTNDAPAIMAIQQYAMMNSIGTLYFPKTTERYVVEDTLTIDISKICWIGDRSKIKYVGTQDVPIIRLTSEGNYSPYRQQGEVFTGFEVYGTDKTMNTGIHFEGTSHDNSVSHIKVNANIHDVKFGVTFFSHAYLIRFDGDIWNTSICAYMLGGGEDYGENIKLEGALFNSDLALRNDNQGGEFFVEASIDYTPRIAVANNGGRIHLSNSHIEFHTISTIPIELRGDGAIFKMVNGSFVTNGAIRPDYFVHCDAGNNGGAWFQDVYMGTLHTNTDFFANIVKGIVKITNAGFNAIPSMPRFISNKHNKLIDGSFTKTSIVDEIFISSDTAPITNSLSGKNLTLTLDESQSRSGGKSLKATKSGNIGPSKFCIVIPTSHYKKLNFKLYYKKYGAELGTFYIIPGFAKIVYDSNCVPRIKYVQYQGTGTTVNLANLSLEWNLEQSNAAIVTAPAWASHYLIEVNMDYCNSGSLFFSDIMIAEM